MSRQSLSKQKSFALGNFRPPKLTRAKSAVSNRMSWMVQDPQARMPPNHPFGWLPVEPKEVPGPYIPKLPQDFPVQLHLKLEPEDKDTDLAKICSNPVHELPQLVKVTDRFQVPGNDMVLEKGEILMLFFVAELPRVHAVDTGDGSEIWLPVHGEQLYERLPLDPRLDDKLFTGVTGLLRFKPMPSVVRVLDGYGSDDYTECLDQEDILTISHIEEKVKRDKMQKVVIAKNQIGHRLELHQDMDCAVFTSMLSALFLHMSEIVEFDFPQRVRVVKEKDFEKRQRKEEKIFKLLSFGKDYQIIAARAKKPGLLSIPIATPVSINVASFKEKTVQSCMPPLFSSLNLSWGIKEVGRRELPEKLTGISQPLPEPLQAWLKSFEGKEQTCEVANVHKADLVRDLKEMTNYNKDLINRLSALSQLDAAKPVVPDRVKPGPPPPRPPKPSTLKKPDIAAKPIPKPRSASESDSKTTVTKFEPKVPSVGTDGYEIPTGYDSFEEEEEEYEEIPDGISSKNDSNKTTNETCKELKQILQRKEQVITKLKTENEKLKHISNELEKDKETLRLNNVKKVDEIYRLQGEVDRLLSRDDHAIYDVINPTERPLPLLPQSTGSTIYSTPDTLMVERAMLSHTDSEGVSDILRQIGLSRYVDKLKEEEVDGALLVTLDETVLKEDLGMTGLHAHKLLLEIKKRTK